MKILNMMPIWLLFARSVWFPLKQFTDGDTKVLKRQYDADSTTDASGWLIAGMIINVFIIVVAIMNIG